MTSDALGYLVRRLEIAIKRKKLDSCKLNVNEKLFISSNVKTTVCEFIAAKQRNNFGMLVTLEMKFVY